MANPTDSTTDALKRALLMQSRARTHPTQSRQSDPQENNTSRNEGRKPEKLARPEKLSRPEKFQSEEDIETDAQMSGPPTFVASHYTRAPAGTARFSLTPPLTHTQTAPETPKLNLQPRIDPLAKRTNIITIKISPFEDDLLRSAAFCAGFRSMAAFVRATVLAEVSRMENAGKITVVSSLEVPEDVTVKDFVKKDRAQRRRV